MKEIDIAEQAYLNGYKAGKKEAATDILKEIVSGKYFALCSYTPPPFPTSEMPFIFLERNVNRLIVDIAKKYGIELEENKDE